MDYSLAALKLVSSQLKDVREVASQNSFTLGGILFQRVWLQVSLFLFLFLHFYSPKRHRFHLFIMSQGVLVSSSDGDDVPLLLDDGTGLMQLYLSGDFRHRHWKLGMYVMVVGGYVIRTGEPPMLKVHKIVDLSSSPDREAMWYLEVIEAYKLFYQPLVEEFT
ncbi:hypothetical protein Lal_00034506 [Lupinus albus]|nr:hypothetical protein Lal_00034506 [Lupinus albus]